MQLNDELLIKLFAGQREQFPALRPENLGGSILFDNSAGAQVPEQTIAAISRYYATMNAGKGAPFQRQARLSAMVQAARAEVCTLLGGESWEEVGFGLNATNLTFLFSRAFARHLPAGSVIVTMEGDHDANVATWLDLKRDGFDLRMVYVQRDGSYDLAELEEKIQGAALVTAGWVSNANGCVRDLAALGEISQRHGAMLFVDGVQRTAHGPINLKTSGVDVAVFSAYKMFSPHMGFFWAKRAAQDELRGIPYNSEASKFDRPVRFEAGTQNFEGIAGLLGTLEYLRDLGAKLTDDGSNRACYLAAMNAIVQYEQLLAARFLAGLQARGDAEVYGPLALAQRTSVVAFNLHGYRPEQIAQTIADAGYEGRVGNYYSPRYFKRHAEEFGSGAMRASMVHYNTLEEVDRYLAALPAVR